MGPEVACLISTRAWLVLQVIAIQDARVHAHQQAALPGHTKDCAPRCIWHSCKVKSHIRCTIQGAHAMQCAEAQFTRQVCPGTMHLSHRKGHCGAPGLMMWRL